MADVYLCGSDSSTDVSPSHRRRNYEPNFGYHGDPSLPGYDASGNNRRRYVGAASLNWSARSGLVTEPDDTIILGELTARLNGGEISVQGGESKVVVAAYRVANPLLNGWWQNYQNHPGLRGNWGFADGHASFLGLPETYANARALPGNLHDSMFDYHRSTANANPP